MWLALTGRNSGTRPSELAGIPCENAALDFDLTCSFRLQLYDAETMKTNAKLIAYECSKIFSESRNDDPDEYSGRQATNGDPYADENTQYW